MKTKANIGILGIIIIIVILAFAFGIFGTGSLIAGSVKMQASNVDYRTWSISPIGSQSLGASGGKINFQITHPSENGVKEKLLCDKINSLTSETCEYQGTSEPTSTFNSRVGIQYNELLGEQFIFYEGTYLDMDCRSHSFKTYGMCKSFDCWVYDPAPDLEYGGGDCTFGGLSGSMKSYFKSGGYTEESGKIEFGFAQAPATESPISIIPKKVVLEPSPTTDTQTGEENLIATPPSLINKINNFIQSIVNWIKGIFS